MATLERVLSLFAYSAAKPSPNIFGIPLTAPTLAAAIVAFVTALLTSSVLSTILAGRSARRAERVRQRRRIARRALAALGAAQATVNRLGDAPSTVSPGDQSELAARNIELEAAVALSGDTNAIRAARHYREASERYVSGALGTNATSQRARFESLVDLLANFVSSRSGRL